MTLHKHFANLLKDEITLEELTTQFIVLIKESIIPFIKKLEDMYYSKVDITVDEQKHLQELKDVVLRYLQFEARVLERIHNRDLLKCLDKEIADVRKITNDISKFQLDGLEKDFEELLCVLELMQKRIKKTLNG
ncbi:MAG TPA: hypothetical protein VK158_01860 [Acidobacteriota bacterium]|nr:hypothetical protein [Acidobacteriota bacterium]